MGEETKIEKLFLNTEDGQGYVFEGIKDIQFTECVEHDYYDDTVVVPSLTFIRDRDVTFTAETKWPKYFRCKNRKRYKKLLMSLGAGRNYADWLIERLVVCKEIWPKECNFSYQELWNEARSAAMKAHFNTSASSPTTQSGIITYTF
jgi:hypothetical protein